MSLIMSKNNDNFFLNKKNTLQTVKSFVCRRRVIKNNFFKKYKFLWKNLKIDFQKKKIFLQNFFLKKSPIILNLGFGNGIDFLEIVSQNLNLNFIGIEVYSPSILSILREFKKYNLSNIRIIFYDAIDVFYYMIPDSSIYILQIFFPDPWPKKKHQKRRLIQRKFLQILSKKIIFFGFLHIKTDCKKYSQHITNIMFDHKEFKFVPIKPIKFLCFQLTKETKFEQRGKKLGFTIFEHIYQLRK